MKNFLKKLSLFFAPIALLVTVAVYRYVKVDPFYDFKDYKNYSWTYFFQHLGDLSTKKLLQSHTEYNAFVFGSSRSTSIYACHLNRVLPGSNFFHFGSWNESIGGIEKKLKFLESQAYPIKHAVIYIDTDFSFEADGVIDPFDHYMLTGKSKKEYYLMHFHNYFQFISVDKLKILFGLEVSGEIYPNWKSDPITNDSKVLCTDSVALNVYRKSEITSQMLQAVQNKKYAFKQISQREKNSLEAIKEILEKHHTAYRIIVTPTLDQMSFHPEDQAVLKKLFGAKLLDFSGTSEVTANAQYYPDGIHFKDAISKVIMDIAWEKGIE